MQIDQIRQGSAYYSKSGLLHIVVAVGKYEPILSVIDFAVEVPLIKIDIHKGVSNWFTADPDLPQRKVVTVALSANGSQQIEIIAARELVGELDPSEVKKRIIKHVAAKKLKDTVEVVRSQEDSTNRRISEVLQEITGESASMHSYYSSPFRVLVDSKVISQMVALWLKYQSVQEPVVVNYNPDEILDEFQDLCKSLSEVRHAKEQAQHTSDIVQDKELEYDQSITSFTEGFVKVAS